VSEEFLREDKRAEDIILGSLGIGEDATIVSLERTLEGYKGTARWSDGDSFEFESEDTLDDLQLWALEILLSPSETKRGS